LHGHVIGIPACGLTAVFVTAQGSAYMRFRRALDRGNVTEALSAASEIQFVGLADALELTLLLADKEPEKYERAAARWHVRFVQEVPNLDLRESQAVLALLAAIPANRLAAAGLAELLSRRRSCERIAEGPLVADRQRRRPPCGAPEDVVPWRASMRGSEPPPPHAANVQRPRTVCGQVLQGTHTVKLVQITAAARVLLS